MSHVGIEYFDAPFDKSACTAISEHDGPYVAVIAFICEGSTALNTLVRSEIRPRHVTGRRGIERVVQ